jgi:1-deoxy-D-xylulose-5-phosphate reductoisomerase
VIRVVLVGATGSIGRSTLDVLRAHRPEMRLLGAFSHSNVAALAAIAREFGVRYAGLADERLVGDLEAVLDGPRAGAGEDFLRAAIADPETDVVLCAATGAAGLPASFETVRQGKSLALANKESLVAAGPLLTRMARETGARILPVDSEHSAVFQALRSGRRTEVRKVILTASGRPFRTWTKEAIDRATPSDALNHPTWSMGPKITVDSATLMNKTLELIEAHWLFDLAPEQLAVAIHPQSVVHSLVEFQDGSILAQMGRPDMRLPIQFALTYPERRGPSFTEFDIKDFASLTFEEPDPERFPALALAERVIRLGGTAGTVLNAANEVAVERFLKGELAFPAIAETVADVLERAAIQPDPELTDIYAADRAAREDAFQCRI